MSSPEYQGQDIHLEDEYPFADNYTYAYEESTEEETSVTEPITIFLGTLTLTKGQQTQEISLNALDRHPDKIYAKGVLIQILESFINVTICVYNH